MASREDIFQGLVAKMRGIDGIRFVGAKLKSWDDVDKSSQPAIFVVGGDEIPTYQSLGVPPQWRLDYKLYVYVRTDEDPDAPSLSLNATLDSIETALLATEEEKTEAKYQPAYNTTLGGLVVYARMSGQIIKDEGALGDQAVAVVPVEALAVN